ncbi:MAG: ribonuclease HII [bacterium]
MPRADTVTAQVERLRAFDARIGRDAVALLCGVDEVGRGPLAGPVVAAAVILPPEWTLHGLADSKTLTHEQRERLYPGICRQAVAIGIGWVDPGTIDRINILQASLMAMERAIARLPHAPTMVLVDGNQRLPRYRGNQATVVKGDSQSAAIAAAAMVAKVLRDRYMTLLDTLYPHYGFAGHKGYAAPVHLAALQQHGPCPAHRLSFKTKALQPLELAFDVAE